MKTSNKTLVMITLLVSTLLFTPQSWSQKMTMMQKAQHTSPMPGLMMLIQNNAEVLELDNQQLDTIREWRHQNHMISKRLMNEIIELEKEMRTDVLDGLSQQEIDELKEALLTSRGQLIDLKYRCISTMKNTLDDEQWHKLMQIREKQMRISQDPSSRNELQAFLRVSPMPKFMAIVLMHGTELNLSPDQKQALENWRLKNMNHWASLFDQVLTEEKSLTQEATLMIPAGSLMSRFEEVLNKRREMAKMSLACRDNMRKVLNDTQWEFVTEKFDDYRRAR